MPNEFHSKSDGQHCLLIIYKKPIWQPTPRQHQQL